MDLQRLVKDLTVADQIILTSVTTFLTYVLIYLMSRLGALDNRRSNRIAREAEQIEFLARECLNNFNEVLLKLGEASVQVNILQLKISIRSFPGTISEMIKEEYPEIIAKINEAITLSAKLGYMTVDSKEMPGEPLEVVLYDRYLTMLGGINEQQPLEQISNAINGLKFEILAMRSVQMKAFALQHQYVDEKIPSKTLEALKQERDSLFKIDK